MRGGRFILMATCGSPALHLPSALVRNIASSPLGPLPLLAITGICLVARISGGNIRPGLVILGSVEPVTLFPEASPPMISLRLPVLSQYGI